MYYYIDKNEQRKGPFSAQELRLLFNDDIIDDNTLVQMPNGETRPYARMIDGNSTNKPVMPHKPVMPNKSASSVNPAAHVPAPARLKRVVMPTKPAAGPSLTHLGECPHCGKALEGTQVPAKCPNCNARLHPGTESLWGNYAYSLKRYLSFRGRARRKEVWSFLLCNLLVQTLICLVLCAAKIPVDLLYFTLLIISIPLYLLPGLGVAVRRLHDSGKSGWLFLVKWVFAALGIWALFYFYPSQTIGLGFLAVAGVINFVQIFQIYHKPSQPGPNKYGPCALYPRVIDAPLPKRKQSSTTKK